MNKINIYHRPDAVDGVGFLIEHCGRPVHSIVWPDRIGERMTPDDLLHMGVVCKPMGCGKCPSLPPDLPVEVATDVEEPTNESTVVEEADASTEDATADDIKEVSDEATEPAEGEVMTEAQMIRKFLTENPEAVNGDVIKAMGELGRTVTSSQVSRERKKLQA
jgi:hypothetical protein